MTQTNKMVKRVLALVLVLTMLMTMLYPAYAKRHDWEENNQTSTNACTGTVTVLVILCNSDGTEVSSKQVTVNCYRDENHSANNWHKVSIEEARDAADWDNLSLDKAQEHDEGEVSPGSNTNGQFTAYCTMYAVGDSSCYIKFWKSVQERNTYKYALNYYDGTEKLSHSEYLETYSETKPFEVSNGNVTKEGYELLGWSTTLGDDVNYVAGNTITLTGVNNSLVSEDLYAVWKANTPNPITYTLNYDANGGEGAPKSDTQTDNPEFTVSTVEPTRDGYNFKGWATTATATEPNVGGQYIIPGGQTDATLYAVWEQEITYTVKFVSGGENVIPPQSGLKDGDAFNVPSTDPEKDGYKFTGWSPEVPADKTVNKKHANKDNEIIFEAQWQEISTYTVTYEIVGKTPDGVIVPEDQTVSETDWNSATLKEALTADGYTFSGWCSTDDCAATSVVTKASEVSKGPKDITVYGKFTEIPKTYTLVYDLNFTPITDIDSASLSTDFMNGIATYSETGTDESKDFTVISVVPQAKGYKFMGWNDENEGTKTYKAGETVTVAANATKTLKATWEKIETGNPPAEQYIFTLIYDLNLPQGVKGTDVKYPEGLAFEQTASSADATHMFSVAGAPTLDGYDFKGWMLEGVDYAGKDLTVQPGTTTVVAEWEKVVEEATPSPTPTATPTAEPTEEPTPTPTPKPTPTPTPRPTRVPYDPDLYSTPTPPVNDDPDYRPNLPTIAPTNVPTAEPTEVPTEEPTVEPTEEPTAPPTVAPTDKPVVDDPDDGDDSDEDDDEDTTDVPKTGDGRAEMLKYMVLACFAMLCVGAAALVAAVQPSKKRR